MRSPFCLHKSKDKNRTSKWSSMGGGFSKHYHSGSSKHKKFVIIRSREYNRILEEESLLKELKRPKMFNQISELFTKNI